MYGFSMNFWHLYVLVVTLVVWTGVVGIAGVALGGLLVYRTKREAHEGLFQFRQPDGDASVADEYSPEEAAEAADNFVNKLYGGSPWGEMKPADLSKAFDEEVEEEMPDSGPEHASREER